MANKLHFLILVLTILHGTLAQSQDHPDILADIVRPKQYVIYHTSDDVIIDGKANEEIWQHTPFTENFIDIQGIREPLFGTKVKMLWSDTHLYLYAELEEPHISANLTQHDTVIYYDKDFEIFIDPTDDTYHYIEVEVNALNTFWDLYLDKPYRNRGKALNAFEIVGIQSAIEIHGTLNDARDIDTMWTVEMAIPLEVVLQVGHKGQKEIKDGDYWRMNFSRVHWDQDFVSGKYRSRCDQDGKLLKEYNWVWSDQKVINMHEPEKWGYAYFSTNPPTLPKSYNRPENQFDKQIAYAYYRLTRKPEWKFLKQEKAGFHQPFEQVTYQGSDYIIDFFKTRAGFEFIIKNATLGRQYVLDHNGYLTIIK